MNKDKSILLQKKLFVLDMDGTIYLGDRLLDTTPRFFGALRRNGQDFVCFTNNSSKGASDYVAKLSRMGITGCDVITSGDVTIDYLQRIHGGQSVYLLGTPSLRASFVAAGIRVTDDTPDVVVVGFDTTLVYERLSAACHYIRGGATFVATHLDVNCPTEDGFIPDCGAICAAIALSTGASPKYLGKPFVETVDAIVNATGVQKSDMVFVGDRLYTDIATGYNNGITTVLVLTGETTVDDLAHSEIQPDFVCNSLGDLFDE